MLLLPFFFGDSVSGNFRPFDKSKRSNVSSVSGNKSGDPAGLVCCRFVESIAVRKILSTSRTLLDPPRRCCSAKTKEFSSFRQRSICLLLPRAADVDGVQRTEGRTSTDASSTVWIALLSVAAAVTSLVTIGGNLIVLFSDLSEILPRVERPMEIFTLLRGDF